RGTVEWLPADKRTTAVVVPRNYGEAGSPGWERLRSSVFSGHNACGAWVAPDEGDRTVVVIGRPDPGANFADCQATAMITNNAGADNEERGRPIWICSRPRGGGAEQWSRLVHLDA